MAHHHLALLPANHRQRHFQLPRPAGAGVRHATVDADFRGRIETQAQLIAHLVQSILQIGVEALRIEAAKQGFTGEITARAVKVGELFPPPQGATGRGQAVNETESLGGTDDPLVGTGQHRGIEHHHPAIQLGATQRRVQVQYAAEGMTNAPHRLRLLLQVVDQFIHQVVPVVIRRVPRVVSVLLQMRHLIFGCQRRKQLAVGPRRKTIGVGEKYLLRHTVRSINEDKARLSARARPTAMTVTDRKDDSPVKAIVHHYLAGGFSPSGTTAMVSRDTQLALPSSLVKRISQTWVVRPI
ncbi:hypothetical protein D3C76_1045310 [compost metagenome]